MRVPESVSVAFAVQVTTVPTGCGDGSDPESDTTGVAELDTGAASNNPSTKTNSKHLRAFIVLFIRFFLLEMQSPDRTF
jgi:hypothetical protein